VAREVAITGIGLVSALGEGEAQHYAALSEGGLRPEWVDSEKIAPFPIHPIRNIDLNRTIPKKGDQRAMGPFMHYGVHAAGLALEDAKIAGDAQLLARTHLIAGCGGGERDVEVDEKIMLGLPGAGDPGAYINDVVQTDLRPTLFLAQLPNLFAGNISIVHGVTGSSRTFMGEEMAGVDAVRVAFERIAADQGDVFLVGSAYNADRTDILTLYAAGGVLARAPLKPLWERGRDGIAFGSIGAFLVVESLEHALARGAQPIARLSAVLADQSDRSPGAASDAALAQWNKVRAQLGAGPIGVLSGASGAAPATTEERDFLQDLEHPAAVRGTAAALGHGMEAAFIANLALAASCARRGRLFPPLSGDGAVERPLDEAVAQIVVTQWGHHRGEATALVERWEQG